MQANQEELNQATEELREDWSFLKQFEQPVDSVKGRSAVFVCELNDSEKSTQAYVKIYANRKHPFQRFLRKGRSCTEVRNLLFFKSIGITTPRVVAWGEKRNGIGRIVQEFIITEAEPETQQLDHFVAEHCPDQSHTDQSVMRLQIAEQLGRWTRAMHDAKFVHEDLKWRNVLARRTGADSAELFWIDCPKGYFCNQERILARKRLKDCATLDKVARVQCSKNERQAFIKAYLGTGASNDEVHGLCNAIEQYRQGRFDAKDNLQRKHGEN